MKTYPAAVPSGPAPLDKLTSEVITPGWCVACGACLGLCPYLIFYDGVVAAPDTCGLTEGRCYDLCPQALDPDSDTKRAQLLRLRGRDFIEPIGPCLEVWWARATARDLKARVQYGGVVSALTALALECGLVEAAVLTRAGRQGAPLGVSVTDRDGVLSAAGSIYAGSGSLMELNQALARKVDYPLLAVGLPCQCLGAATMQSHPNYPAAAKRLMLIIGLFCSLNLKVRALRQMLAEAGVTGPVHKSDFPPPPSGIFRIHSGQGEIEIPLEKVYPAVMPGCSLCPDLTAEMADISVGAAEGFTDLNLMIVRSEAGMRLVRKACDKGVVELREPDAASLEHLEQAANNKRQRARTAQQER